ncbi:MAG TPA: hypothetical protein VGM30_15360 [Puia sp.]|jgi:hypothetical protein
MVKKAHSVLFHTLLLSVYAVFFSVQFFFNFDGPGPGNYSPNIFTQAAAVHHSPLPPTGTHTIRLNKRFHQENITPCDVFFVDVPTPYIMRRTLGDFRDVFLPSFTPIYRPLRGPPIVA